MLAQRICIKNTIKDKKPCVVLCGVFMGCVCVRSCFHSGLQQLQSRQLAKLWLSYCKRSVIKMISLTIEMFY